MQGRLQELLAKEGDAVKQGQLLGRIQPQEWKADVAFYADSEQQSAAQVDRGRGQPALPGGADRQPDAPGRGESRRGAGAGRAGAWPIAENARLNFEREEAMYRKGVESAQAFDQARTAYDAPRRTSRRCASRSRPPKRRSRWPRATPTRSPRAAPRSTPTSINWRRWARRRRRRKVHLDYTEIRAPIDGIVDVRAALQGEVVSPGQGDRHADRSGRPVGAGRRRGELHRLGPPRRHDDGAPAVRRRARRARVFYRGVDADYATQRDVSRTKRDIKTFEIRLRCDNADRSLAVGMTAYVILPLAERTTRRAAPALDGAPSDPCSTSKSTT